jgi:cytochrome P450
MNHGAGELGVNPELDELVVAYVSDPVAREAPYDFYRRMVVENPVHWSPVLGMWLAFDYESVSSVARDRRLSREQANAADHRASDLSGKARRAVNGMVLFRDPPEHTRLRSFINRVFSTRAAEDKRPVFNHHINDLLEELQAKPTVEFVSEVGRVVPFMMICDLIGLPSDNAEKLQEWTDAYVSMLEVNVTPEMEAAADLRFEEFLNYLAPIVAERRSQPRDDLLSDLVAAHVDGHLTEDELGSYVLFLFVAGHETTTYILANGLYTLLENRDQWQLLTEDQSLKVGAVEEILRCESTGRALLPRWALEDLELSGRAIRKGEMIMAIEAAANRDPKIFADPDRFDIRRENSRLHLSFGAGLHLCSGAALSRVEAQEVLSTVAKRFPDVTVEGDIGWRPDWIVRAVQSLPVSLAGRS